MAVIPERIQLARGTAAAWTAANPVLLAGEAGFESDTGQLKFGDGATAWNSLTYFAPIGAVQSTLTGTTTGTAISAQPFSGANYKKFLVYFNGYENTTATPQTITYPVAFIHTPRTVADDAGCTVTATTLTLPVSMSSAVTGWLILEGF
jgi:hypothetical protein